MSANIEFSLKQAIIFNIFFLGNYCVWLFGFQNLASLVFAGLLIYFLYFCLNSIKLKQTLPALIIFYLLLLSIGTVAIKWDARSIWLFHAKRMFIDNSIFAQLDNYAIWSHNDYPVMLPLLSASFAKLVGFWNEIFPKTSNIFFILPPLLIFYSYLKSNRWFVFFSIGAFFILAKLIFNGYMDGILTLYTISTLIILHQFRLNPKNKTILLLAILQSCILVSIKNEGMFILTILIISLLLTNLSQLKALFKKLWIFVIPYLFWLIWRLCCQYFQVGNDMEKGLLGGDNLMNNIYIVLNDRFSFQNISLISQNLFFFKFYLFGVIAIGIAIKNKFIHWGKLDAYLLTFICIYLLFLFSIYLITPHDLSWHLGTSTNRTSLPIQLASFFLFLNALKTNK